jgi:hypothetical protein
MPALPTTPRAAGKLMADILDRIDKAGGDPVDAADEMVKNISYWLQDFWESFSDEEFNDKSSQDWLLIHRATRYQGELGEGPDLGAINDEMEAEFHGYTDED